MKAVLFSISAGILLLGCADSKEMPSSKIGQEISVPGKRVVAREYQVFTDNKLSVDCLSQLSGAGSPVLHLQSGDRVTLASAKTSTQRFAGASWLRVYRSRNPEIECYVETQYLVPVPRN